MENKTLSLDNFNPTVAELQKLVLASKEIPAVDFKDKNGLEIVKKKRIELGKVRVAIEKTGKEFRAEALAFQKKVIAKQKELIAIIEPEELRLKAIEETAKEFQIKEKRLKDLPARKERLASIGDGQDNLCDDDLLEMDDTKFEIYYSQRLIDKKEADKIKAEQELEAEREKIEAERKKIDDERRKLEEDKRIKEAEERARKDEQERARLEAERKEQEEKERKEAEEKKEKEDAERLAKEKRYQSFLVEHGYSEKTKDEFYILNTDKKVRLYRIVGEFIK